MRIAVCIKQVPDVSELKFDPVRKTLIREGVKNVVSAYDRRAITQAVALVKERGGEVVVFTMGPPQAREALVECLAVGADRAVHLEDRAFAGSDTLATARALALALKHESAGGEFDLILCGKYSIDSETGQVGPEVAELLDIPHVSGATGIESKDDQLIVTRETDEGLETIEVPRPCLLTAAERLIRPAKVKDPEMEAARSKPISLVRAADLSDDLAMFGVAGSPTSVSEIYELRSERHCQFVSPEELMKILAERGLLGAAASRSVTGHRTELKRYTRKSAAGADYAIWALTEFVGDRIRPVTFELLGCGLELADQLGGEVAAVIISGAAAADDSYIDQLAAHGAEKVYILEHPALSAYSPEGWANALARAIEMRQPWAVLIPATANGRDYAPRVAARLGLGLTGDCIGLKLDDEHRLVQLKPAFGGQIVAPILSRTYPQMATVRPGMLQSLMPDASRQAVVETLAVDPLPIRTRLLARTSEALETVQLDQAAAVVCVGMGLGGPENLPLIEELGRVLGAAIGATRRVVDAGWLPRQYQVGLTGRSIAPRLYLGVGVRGAFNHTIGIQRADVIAAINSDPQAEIFQTADYGIVGDVVEVSPELIKLATLLSRSE
jgi:electron transfer flavoprotein alpha subunit